MKPATFFKGLSWLIFLNFLIKPIWIFFIDREVQNIVGFEAYGVYFSLFNLTFILSFLADAGISNMLNQRLAAKEPINPIQLLEVKGVLVVVYTCICLLVAAITGIGNWEILIYLIAVQGLTSLIIFLRNLITASQLFTADAWFSVLDKSILILLCAGFIYGIFNQIDLNLFLKFQIFSASVSLIALSIFAFHKNLLTTGEKEQVKTIFRHTAPFAIIILLMSLHYRLDGFLLERLHVNGALEAGIYASAYRLLDAANMVGFLTASFLVPFIARNKNNLLLTKKVVTLTRNGLLLLSAGALVLVFFFASDIQQLLYYRSDVYISNVIQLTLFALPGYYMVHVYGSLLTATAQFAKFIQVLSFSVIINSILNLLLIPEYGALGTATAAIVSQTFCGITLYRTVLKNKIAAVGV